MAKFKKLITLYKQRFVHICYNLKGQDHFLRSYFGFNPVLNKMYMLARRKIKPKPKAVEGPGTI